MAPGLSAPMRLALAAIAAWDAGCSRSHFKMLYFSLRTHGKNQHLIKLHIPSKNLKLATQTLTYKYFICKEAAIQAFSGGCVLCIIMYNTTSG